MNKKGFHQLSGARSTRKLVEIHNTQGPYSHFFQVTRIVLPLVGFELVSLELHAGVLPIEPPMLVKINKPLSFD